jgi:hypothetical protein
LFLLIHRFAVPPEATQEFVTGLPKSAVSYVVSRPIRERDPSELNGGRILLQGEGFERCCLKVCLVLRFIASKDSVWLPSSSVFFLKSERETPIKKVR